MVIKIKRPKYHFTPPRGWMNDPCAPFWDEKTGIYHVWYQYVPNHTEWNVEIGWGHAWTRDFLHWEGDVRPALMPDAEGYDDQGVFTGNLDVRTIGSDKLVAMYSCINDLAKKQATEGYQWGQERLALASSSDHGKSWTKDPQNPIPLFPPKHVTGWRDPYIFPSPSLDALTGAKEARHYCIISGGVESAGPTVFLYALPTTDRLHEAWEYLGPLVRPVLPPKTPSPWAGDRGTNWECAGLFNLPASSGASSKREEEVNWLIIGSDGHWVYCLPDEKTHSPPSGIAKPPMWQLWLAGSFNPSDAPPSGGEKDGYHVGKEGMEMDVKFSGVLDWGCAYATQTFPGEGGRRLMIAWLVDHDLAPEGRAKQTYSGAFTHPRELFHHTLAGVVGALQSPLDELPSFEVTRSQSTGGHTLRTLGIKPAREVQGGRREAIDFGEMKSSDAWEVQLVTSVHGADEVGIELSFEGGHTAEVIFLPAEETILVRRIDSVPEAEKEHVNVNPELGKHTLFLFTSGEWEKLDLMVMLDGTILEVFANDRFALSTHLYGGACSVRPIRKGGAGGEGDAALKGWYH